MVKGGKQDVDMIQAYFDNARRIMDQVLETQKDKLFAAAEKLCEASLTGHNIFAFGCSHAALVMLELYYRSGGMATINPLRAPGLCLDIDPATMTSQMERLPDYGRVIIDHSPLKEGDVIIIHSVSGRNPVTVDVAIRAREKGAYVIALTNMTTSAAVQSRHASGLNLYQAADLVLDNCGQFGDASLAVEGLPQKVAPTSTVVGAAMLNAVMAQAVQLIQEKGEAAPVFLSANVEGGEKHNQQVLEKYGQHIFYMGH